MFTTLLFHNGCNTAAYMFSVIGKQHLVTYMLYPADTDVLLVMLLLLICLLRLYYEILL